MSVSDSEDDQRSSGCDVVDMYASSRVAVVVAAAAAAFLLT